MNPLAPIQPLGGAVSGSPYLAQALQSLQGSAQPLRTPADLGTDMLADALTQNSKKQTTFDANQGAMNGVDANLSAAGIQPPPTQAVPPGVLAQLGGLFGLGAGKVAGAY